MASRRKREQKAAAEAKAKAAAALSVRKPSPFRYALIIGLGVLALIASFAIVPALARHSGLHEQHVNYALGVAALLIGIVTTKWIRSLKKPARTK